MNGGKNGAVCGLNWPQKEVYRCVRDAPHCLIKQKVDLFKSNFAQGLGGRGEEGGRKGISKQAWRAEKGTAGPREAVKCMLSSLKCPGTAAQLLPFLASYFLT